MDTMQKRLGCVFPVENCPPSGWLAGFITGCIIQLGPYTLGVTGLSAVTPHVFNTAPASLDAGYRQNCVRSAHCVTGEDYLVVRPRLYRATPLKRFVGGAYNSQL